MPNKPNLLHLKRNDNCLMSKTLRAEVRGVFLSMLGNRWLALHRSTKVCAIAVSDMSKATIFVMPAFLDKTIILAGLK